MRTKYKLLTFIATLLLGISANSYALPFIIVPDGTLPTTVNEGSTVDAAYTVTNNTRQTRTGNFVKYLPPNVTQNTGSGCGATFDLASGASCVLNLVVSGAVNANDPNPQDHLFVCMSDGLTCAGTNYPLNVTVNPTPPITDAQYPLMSGSSPVGGEIWGIDLDSSTALPSEFADLGVINGVSCLSSGVCLAVGSYHTDTIAIPSIAKGAAGGKGWSYVVDGLKGDLPTNYDHGGVFNSVSCSSTTCVAGGTYQIASNASYPMLAVSPDEGVTWSYAVEEGAGLPTDIDPTAGLNTFTSVTCSSTSYCIAVGFYQSTTGGNKQSPMVATTVNGGTTWTYYISAVSGAAAGLQSGAFNSVACTGSGATAVCAVGGYYTFSGQQYALLATSTFGGTAWDYEINEANPPTSNAGSGVFESVSCSGATTTAVCAAAGSYTTTDAGNPQLPLLALSTNAGAVSPVWSYPIETGSNEPPGVNGRSQFFAVSCTGLTTTTICAAGGTYESAGGAFPMLVVTANGGNAWTYQVDASTNLPASIDSTLNFAQFSSISCVGVTSTAICAAGGFYFVLGTDNDVRYPMLLVSTNVGAGSPVWTYEVEFDLNLPTDFVTGGYNSVSCAGTVCGVGGLYQNYTTPSGSNKLQYSPLEVSANNGGSSDPRYFASLGVDFTIPTASLGLSPLGSSEGEVSRVMDWLYNLFA